MNSDKLKQAKQNLKANYRKVAILTEVFCINCNYEIVQEKDITICLSENELQQKAESLHKANHDKNWCDNPLLLIKYKSALLSNEAYAQLAGVK
jgi:hypothetical protein